MASSSSPKSPESDDRMNESSSSNNEESNARRETDLCERDDEQTKKKFKTEPVSTDHDRSTLSTYQLRIKSRHKYLEKRKEKKVQELEDELRDEEYLFQGGRLTKRERKNIKFKRIPLQLARDHEKAQQMKHIDRYHMPTGKSDETSKADRFLFFC